MALAGWNGPPSQHAIPMQQGDLAEGGRHLVVMVPVLEPHE